MCGIFGALGHIDKININKVYDDLYHRGPDNQNYFSYNNLLFVHTRLAIIDLEKEANQPMQSDKVLLVFNGEIYNYKQLIQQYNLKMNTKSDTEVIIRLYEKLGISFVNDLNGMFAIALYDKVLNKLFLIRDRFGKKPLFYTFKDKTFYFSSEIKALYSQTNTLTINDESVYHYLSYLSPQIGESFFQDINKLEAGHILEIDINMKPTFHTYFNTKNIFNKNINLPFDQIVIKTDELLQESIRLRLISDRKVAISLSGGIDSSLNLYYAKQLKKDIYAINITYKGFENSESKRAEKYAKELGVTFIPLEIDIEEYFNVCEELKELIDTPFIWMDMILIYLISKKLKELDIRVLLVGEGGDELGAYQSYFELLDIYDKFTLNQKHYISLSRSNPQEFDLVYNNSLISKRHIHGFYENEKKSFLKNKPNSYKQLWELMEEIDDQFISKILNLEYRFRIPEILLARLDYATMQNSVEARAPFLDKDLVEFTLSTDFFIRNHNKEPKAVLKTLAQKYLPSYIYNAKKQGFGYEFQNLLETELKKRYNIKIINNKQAPIKEYLPLEFLAQNHLGYRYWMLYSLNDWLIKVSKCQN